MNKHDIDNLKVKWNRFCKLSYYGEYDLKWGIVIGFCVANLLYYIWG